MSCNISPFSQYILNAEIWDCITQLIEQIVNSCLNIANLFLKGDLGKILENVILPEFCADHIFLTLNNLPLSCVFKYGVFAIWGSKIYNIHSVYITLYDRYEKIILNMLTINQYITSLFQEIVECKTLFEKRNKLTKNVSLNIFDIFEISDADFDNAFLDTDNLTNMLDESDVYNLINVPNAPSVEQLIEIYEIEKDMLESKLKTEHVVQCIEKEIHKCIVNMIFGEPCEDEKCAINTIDLIYNQKMQQILNQ